MAFELKVRKERMLKIIYNGNITADEVRSVRENAIAMINANNLNKICCDIRGAYLDLSGVDLFNFAASNKKVYPKIIKTALVYSVRKNDQDDLLLYQATASRRGFNLKIFENYDKAIQWLES